MCDPEFTGMSPVFDALHTLDGLSHESSPLAYYALSDPTSVAAQSSGIVGPDMYMGTIPVDPELALLAGLYEYTHVQLTGRESEYRQMIVTTFYDEDEIEGITYHAEWDQSGSIRDVLYTVDGYERLGGGVYNPLPERDLMIAMITDAVYQLGAGEAHS